MSSRADEVDHRTRVAAVRRAQMRRRLIESAMIVLARKGNATNVIQEVVAVAGVSQGSFYNYFRTAEDLMLAVGVDLSGEVVQLIQGIVGEIDDPAWRVGTAIRCYLDIARSFPVVARYLASSGFQLVERGSPALTYLPADLKDGIERGSFTALPMNVALDLVLGVGLIAVRRISRGRTPRNYPAQIAGIALRALGVPPEVAETWIAKPLPRLVPTADSLLARAQARYSGSAAESRTSELPQHPA